MPWLRMAGNTIEVELPKVEIGLLQSEAEAPRTPAYDLFQFLETKTFDVADGNDPPGSDGGLAPRWGVRLFSERTFGGVLHAPGPIDTLVIGYNAIHLSPRVKAALHAAPPISNLVVLHQLAPDCLAFLRGRLAIELHEMPGGTAEHAHVPAERDAGLEPLLNWPARVFRSEPVPIRARAVRYVVPAPGSSWEVVLEARIRGRRFPVVVRTSEPAGQRIVLCTLLLEPRPQRPGHSELVENIVTYAATGAPRVAVLEPDGASDDGYDAIRLTERLRVQGESAVHVRVKGTTPPLGAWPLRGTQRTVAPASLSYASARTVEGAAGWFGAGGAFVRVGRDGVTTHSETSDAEWVARRWAAWLASTEPEAWQGSVFRMRAVLRTLQVVHTHLEDEIRDVGLQGPLAYERRVRALIDRRVRRGAVEGTIGATVAAYDLDSLVERGAMTIWTRRRVEAWLRGEFNGASPEDRFDIARCLQDDELWAEALEGIRGKSVSATLVVRLREAAAACPRASRAQLAPQPLDAMHDARVLHELRASPQLAAEFMAAVYGWTGEPDHVLAPARVHVASRAAAVEGLTRLRGLASERDLTAADPHAVSTEAFALVRWLSSEGGTAFQVPAHAGTLPVKTVEGVLAEALRAREQEEQLRDAAVPLGNAIHVLGSFALAAVVVALLAVVRLLDVNVTATEAWVALAAVGVAAVALGAVRSVRPGDDARDRTATAISLAQTVVGTILVLIAVGAATAAIRLVNRPIEVIVIVAGIVAGAGVLVSRTRLAPAWLALPLEWAIDPKRTAESVTGRLRRGS
jgi:hypothetical protein